MLDNCHPFQPKNHALFLTQEFVLLISFGTFCHCSLEQELWFNHIGQGPDFHGTITYQVNAKMNGHACQDFY